VPKFVKRSISYGDNQKIVDLNQRILQYVALSTTGWAHYAAFEKKIQPMTIKPKETGSTYTMTLSFFVISPGFNIDDIC